MEPIADFGLMITVQVAILLLFAYATGNVRDLCSRHMVYALALGLTCGFLGDEILGAHLRVFSYSLGFTPAFLVLNDLFSYGIWIATVMVIRNVRALPFFASALLVAVLYEAANYIFPVWHWSFLTANVQLQECVVLLYYLALGLVTAFSIHTLGIARFAIFERQSA